MTENHSLWLAERETVPGQTWAVTSTPVERGQVYLEVANQMTGDGAQDASRSHASTLASALIADVLAVIARTFGDDAAERVLESVIMDEDDWLTQ